MFTKYHQYSADIFSNQSLFNKVEKLKEHDVHVWSLTTDIYDELKNNAKNFLNENEQNRAQRFRFRKHHDLFVIGRYITKIMVAHYTESLPEKINIIQDSYGKPTCEKNLYFNISHSEEQLLLGFSNSKIGVDIERNDPTVDIESIAGNHFSEIEFQKMMSYTGDERVESFFEIWTKKESLIKGIGKGLRIPLQDFSVTGQNGKVLGKLLSGKSYGNWYVQNIDSSQGYTSAFASQHKKADISYFSLG